MRVSPLCDEELQHHLVEREREGERERGREGEKERERERGREGEREGGREREGDGGREGGREQPSDRAKKGMRAWMCVEGVHHQNHHRRLAWRRIINCGYAFLAASFVCSHSVNGGGAT
jgi:hypothetical protein